MSSHHHRRSTDPIGPRPSRARPESRSLRKKLEKESGFSWTDGLELALLGAVAIFSIDRELEHLMGGSSSSTLSHARSDSGRIREARRHEKRDTRSERASGAGRYTRRDRGRECEEHTDTDAEVDERVRKWQDGVSKSGPAERDLQGARGYEDGGRYELGDDGYEYVYKDRAARHAKSEDGSQRDNLRSDSTEREKCERYNA